MKKRRRHERERNAGRSGADLWFRETPQVVDGVVATAVTPDDGPLQAVAVVEMSDTKRPYIVNAQAEAVVGLGDRHQDRAQQKIRDDLEARALHQSARPQHPAMRFREALRRSLSTNSSHSAGGYADLAAEEEAEAMMGDLISPSVTTPQEVLNALEDRSKGGAVESETVFELDLSRPPEGLQSAGEALDYSPSHGIALAPSQGASPHPATTEAILPGADSTEVRLHHL